jgi:hypothetical protein
MYLYDLGLTGAGYRATSQLTVTYTSTGTFSSGQTITVNDGFMTYYGHYQNGWVGISNGHYYLLSNDNGLTNQIIPIQTTDFTTCFLAGTRLATQAGERCVEDVVIGDLVLTAEGRAAAVRWIGVQTIVSVFADPLRSFPIRITGGALGEGLPSRDLLLSPDHALFLDGVLVQAGALVNGTTIVRETAMPERFTYFHIELDGHGLVLAEAVPAETFVDNVARRRFDNFASYEALYGAAEATIPEMDVPRVKSARQLPRVLRDRLGLRDGTSPAQAA